MKVKFIDVGRNKVNWEAECPELSGDWLYQQVTDNGKLMSRNIDFFIKEDGVHGIIVAGFHNIGKFEILRSEMHE